MNENGTYQWSPANGPKKNFDFKKFPKLLLIGAIVLVLIIAATTCFYTVDEKEVAVVTTFGKVTDTAGAGVHFKLPFGIQQERKVNANVYQKIELGYVTTDSGAQPVLDECSMITGDYNIVNVDFFIEYKISDPVA